MPAVRAIWRLIACLCMTLATCGQATCQSALVLFMMIHPDAARGVSPRLTYLKPDPLGQGWGSRAVIGGAGLATHGGFPGVRPGFAASPRVLLPPERSTDFGAARTD